MSTNCRIGYLENDEVRSIYCHSDGYTAFVGVLLNECYKNLDKIKELVARGNCSSLGTKILNTKFYGGEDEQADKDHLLAFKRRASYHYLFDTKTNKWKLYHEGKTADLSNVVNDFNTFYRIDGGTYKEPKKVFESIPELKDAFANNYQTWWDPNDKLIESIIDKRKSCVDVYFTDYHFGEGMPAEEIHTFIPCSSYEDGVKISDNILGKLVDEIKKEYNLSNDLGTRPDLQDVINSCQEINKNGKAQSPKNEYYKTSDGFFDYYVNRKTGEKKFKLDENDVEVERKVDDFSRDTYMR